MSRNIVRTVLSIAAVAFAATFARAQAQRTYISFDVPGAALTSVQGINAEGAVVGFYTDTNGKQHGFLLSGGSVTTIDYSGALATIARGINSHGDIVGTHVDAANLPGGGLKGFLLKSGGFTDVNYPGHLNTIAQRINDEGLITGCYHDTDTMGTMHSMMFDGVKYSDIGTPASMGNGALPDGSVTTGFYTDMMTNVSHAYLESGGNVAPFDFPFSIGTAAWDLNPSGQVVGNYTDAAKKGHGFLLTPSPFEAAFGITPEPGLVPSYTFESIDFPGAVKTNPFAINSRGDIVGSYGDSAGKTHGFLSTPARRRQRTDQQ
ncbi:MAG: hypothetical protein LAQ69_34000 [Acidobacteriia bacterium]|nr:hypothetical protein [Terriglobia bacterium]